ncbi:MAG TPA: hypothetical protein VGT44_09410 [Ktedonobacteraceae bacterium]|nr:hypothetical protein [Ktedonobacteraceae bacterium]
MHQDRLGLFAAGEEPEVLCLLELVAPFGETGFKSGAVGPGAVHHDHLSD